MSLASVLIAELFNALVLFLYFWLAEAAFGATVGKTIVGIRVVQITDRPRLSAFAFRNLLRLVDGLGFYLIGALIAGCSRIHRRTGDLCAGTAVIEDEFGYFAKAGSVGLCLVAIGAAVWLVPRICKCNSAVHARYLDQVVLRVGRNNKSAYLSIASYRIEVQTPAMIASGATRQ